MTTSEKRTLARNATLIRRTHRYPTMEVVEVTFKATKPDAEEAFAMRVVASFDGEVLERVQVFVASDVETEDANFEETLTRLRRAFGYHDMPPEGRFESYRVDPAPEVVWEFLES